MLVRPNLLLGRLPGMMALSAAAPSAPAITAAGDEDFSDLEQNITITGTDFGASQGTGKVEIGDNATYGAATLVELAVDSWSDTSIQIDMQETVTGNSIRDDVAFGTLYLFVTNDAGDRSDGHEVVVHYAPTTTRFDGTTDNLRIVSATNMPAASAEGLISFWVKTGDVATYQIFSQRETGGDPRMDCSFTDGTSFGISLDNGAGTLVLRLQATNALPEDGLFHHVVISYDLGTAGAYWCRVDDIDVPLMEVTFTVGETVDWVSTSANEKLHIGSSFAGSTNFLPGDLGELYINPNEHLDLDSSNPFIDADGLPVEPNADASNFTGTAPVIFLSGGAADFLTNRGTGDDFTDLGSVIDGDPITVGFL